MTDDAVRTIVETDAARWSSSSISCASSAGRRVRRIRFEGADKRHDHRRRCARR